MRTCVRRSKFRRLRRAVQLINHRKGPVVRIVASGNGTVLHVALLEPEIPPNTGNVSRLCAATGLPLHLIGKLGFRMDDASLRRAGIDYWQYVDLRLHSNFAEFESALAGLIPPPTTGRVTASYSAANRPAYRHGCWSARPTSRLRSRTCGRRYAASTCPHRWASWSTKRCASCTLGKSVTGPRRELAGCWNSAPHLDDLW
jgi:SpoU rRNA Methylase family